MMPYGKKRAHTSTGGQAPRKQLATKAARKNATYIPYEEEDSADEGSPTLPTAPRKQLATKAACKSATYVQYDEDSSADEGSPTLPTASNAAANEEGPQQRKQRFFTNLLDSMWTQLVVAEEEEESAHGTFAACEVIKPSARISFDPLSCGGCR